VAVVDARGLFSMTDAPAVQTIAGPGSDIDHSKSLNRHISDHPARSSGIE
jgi:hypothetical protein